MSNADERGTCKGTGVRAQAFASMGRVASVVCPRCRLVFEGVRRERWPPGSLHEGREGSAVIPEHVPKEQHAGGK